MSFLRKGEALAYVERIHNLKDLKDKFKCLPICWELEEPKGHQKRKNCANNMLQALQILSTEGRSVCLCWAPSNLKELKDFGDPLRSERKQGFSADPFYGRARCLPMLGSLKT